MAAERFIYSQGQLDGACFLYALANARRAIQRKSIPGERWTSAMLALDSPSDFLDQACGTEKTDYDVIAQTRLANKVIRRLSYEKSPLRARSISGVSSNSDFQNLLSARTALVVADPSHWYCIVDASSNRIYLACSWKLHDQSSRYRELVSGRLGRTYNRVVDLGSFDFFQSRAFLITK